MSARGWRAWRTGAIARANRRVMESLLQRRAEKQAD